MRISINILTWNNNLTILKLLNNVLEDVKDIAHEFILVDNGSDDGTNLSINDWIVRNLSDNFKFIKNKDNLGISIGKNQAIEASSGEYILMLDGDVVPVPNSIRLMIKWMDKNKKKVALGMYPNKFSTAPDHAEPYCDKLIGFRKYKCCCLYYGIFRRSMFDKGLRMSVEGEFGKPGYGWEDHDFFKKMKAEGCDQYVAHINKEIGKYYHNINSSIRAMGRETYMETSRARDKQFKEKWKADAPRSGNTKPS